ncbi:MAG: TRAM domain-containing protein, partial [Muribaculaceae bacterium]|nr:TRAM domain-containing protein [Muribaculaceae bacterium]
MARKRRELPVFENVEIIDVAAEGNSIARVNDLVVFIPYGAPGDIVDVKIRKKKKSFAEGFITNFQKRSDIRKEPICEHFGICGGCRWQHLPYKFQLQCKQQQVKDALERIAKVKIPEIRPILGSNNIWEYRNKMEYTFSNKKWLTFEQMKSEEIFPDRNAVGFHISGAFDKVLDIKKCYLQNGQKKIEWLPIFKTLGRNEHIKNPFDYESEDCLYFRDNKEKEITKDNLPVFYYKYK